MDKRTILAVALCMGILFVWWKVFPPTPPPQPSTVATAPAAVGATGQSVPVSAGGMAAVDPAAAATAPAGPAPEERVTLSTVEGRFVLSSLGGTLREVRLRDKKFWSKKNDPESGLPVVAMATPETAPLRLFFPKADFVIPDNAAYTVTQRAPDSVVFRTETPAVAIEKRYKVGSGRFRLALEVAVFNKTDKPASHNLTLLLYGRQDPDKKGGSFLSYASADVAEMVCFVDEKAKRDNIESLLKEPKENPGNVRWVAADEKFVTLAVVPDPESPPQERKCGRRALDGLTGEIFVSFASRTVAPGATTVYGFTVFAGPKYIEELDRIAPGGQDARLSDLVNVTFAVLSRPLLYLLKLFFGWAGNWGVAIIMLTLFVKLVTFYPTWKTMASAKKMQRLAPEIAKLKKKYDNDRQRLGVETMNMYKSHGVSPFGGCLPSLIQMPIWIALFSTLNYAVELYRSEFFGYIHDLSAKDPFYVTPLAMGAIMYLQMRMSPAGADPQQQKMMAVMMPIMFTGFSLFLPAGLAIYTLTSYLIGIGQQLLVNYLDKRHGGGLALAPAKS